MAFSDQVARLDRRVLKTFRRIDPDTGEPITATLHFQSGAGDVDLDVLTRNPALEEDFIPGSSVSDEAIGVVVLFIRQDLVDGLTESPQKGDTLTYPTGGVVNYNVTRVAADREGGAVLYCRRKAA